MIRVDAEGEAVSRLRQPSAALGHASLLKDSADRSNNVRLVDQDAGKMGVLLQQPAQKSARASPYVDHNAGAAPVVRLD